MGSNAGPTLYHNSWNKVSVPTPRCGARVWNAGNVPVMWATSAAYTDSISPL